MMTARIYYTDPACREFTAKVVESLEVGGRPAVRLDRTAFYPTSGGQPFDTGALGDARVVDVIDVGTGVLHVLDAPLAEGADVTGRVDWDRRLDHAQQHTGQHILSAAFERECQSPTVSFHMGAVVSTIDLSREVTPEEVERAEQLANGVVWADEPVSIRFVSPEEARRLPLRKESLREGTLRLIDIRGFDLSACGGTHARRTGEVGVIAVTGVERFKGGSRVSFACGLRALRAERQVRAVLTAATRALGSAPGEVPAAIERLQHEAREQRKAIKDLRERLARHEARALLDAAQATLGARLIVQTLDGHDPASLKSMAAALVAEPGVAVALFTAGAPPQVVVARSADLSVDAAGVLRLLVERHGGRGGGKADLAQGGGFGGDIRQVLWTATGLLEQALEGRKSG